MVYDEYRERITARVGNVREYRSYRISNERLELKEQIQLIESKGCDYSSRAGFELCSKTCTLKVLSY